MVIGPALRTFLITQAGILTRVGTRVYAGDTPYYQTFPLILIREAGENPVNPSLKNCIIETVTVDIYASHDPGSNVFGYDDVTDISKIIRKAFDAFQPVRWFDSDDTFDVIRADYRGQAVQIDRDNKTIMKPCTITFTYNYIEP